MRVKKTGKEYPHIYDIIISKELFDECQKVRLGHNRKPFKYRSKEFIFRGLVKCGATGKVVTCVTQTKKYKNGQDASWTYLRAWNKKNPSKAVYVREDKVLGKIQKVFDSMIIEPELLTEVVAYIKSTAKTEKDSYNMRIKKLNTENTKLKNRMDRLTDLFLDGDLEKELYEEKRKNFTERRDEIAREIENLNNCDDDFHNILIRLLELASSAGKLFKGSTPSEKRDLINFAFVNLKLNGQKLEYNLRPPFDDFAKTAKTGEWWGLVDGLLTYVARRINIVKYLLSLQRTASYPDNLFKN